MPTHATLDITGKVPTEQLPASSGGVTDHGALTGLTDDDHTQYMNTTRGDARYPLIGHIHSIADVTNLQTSLDGKQSAATVLTNTTASFTTAQETKLLGIASGATVNSSDATLLNRANHTGTQLSTTISDFTTAVLALVSGGSDPWTWQKLALNNTVNTTAYANVTGMVFTALANTTYLVEVIGAYQSAVTTTGIGLTLDIPSGTIIGHNLVSTSATAVGGTEIIADNASTGATTGVRAANTNTPIRAFFVVAIGVPED